MKHIGIVITNLCNGGAERVATMQANYLCDKGYNVTVVTLEPRDDHYALKRKVNRIRLDRDDADEILNVFERLNIDLVIDHIHWSEEHYIFFERLLSMRKKLIIFDHNSFFYPLFFGYRTSMFLNREKIYAKADAVTSLTRHTCALFRQQLDNVVLMPNALSYESDQIADLDNQTIVAVANWLRPEKRFWCILKTFSYVLEKCPHAKLLLVGPYHDNILYGLLHEYGIPEENVDAVGVQKDVAKYYIEASVCLLTSEVEGFGLVLTEAAMHGLPRVIMNVYGLEDVVDDGKDGYIVPSGDCRTASEKICDLFGDDSLRERMGAQAKKTASRYQIGKIGARWEWLINTVLAKTRKEREVIFKDDCIANGIDKVCSKRQIKDFYTHIRHMIKTKPQPISNDYDITAIITNYKNALSNDFVSKSLFKMLSIWRRIKCKKQKKIICKSNFFDSKWYADQYPDIKRAGLDPVEHYLTHGALEGRNPSECFDSWGYISRFYDVAKSGMNPLVHYINHGRSEGRCPSVNPNSFLPVERENSDISKYDFQPHPKNEIKTLEQWAERYHKRGGEVVILHPDWRGINASAGQFSDLDNQLYITDAMSPKEFLDLSIFLGDLAPEKIVFQGLAESWGQILKDVKKTNKDIEIYCIHHGSFYQFGRECDRKQLMQILELNKNELIKKIGFVKHGMAETMRKLGYDASFVMNYVRDIPEGPSPCYNRGGGIHVGVFGREWDWTKPPYVSIVACGAVDGVIPHIIGGGDTSQTLLKQLNIKGHVSDALSPESMPKFLKKMYINMSVSMSDCAPMLPLESLSVGVPCLFSKNNNYFHDNKFLYDMLVVESPDSEYAVARKLEKAIENREKIIKAYIEYAKVYNPKARQSYTEFIS